MMDGVLEAFRAVVSRVELRPPRIPFVSNVTGTWIRDDQAVDPDYWVQHVRRPVLFAPGLAELVAEPRRVLVEVGPGNALCRLARRQAAPGQPVVPSMAVASGRTAEPEALLGALGRLWQAGCPVSWTALSAGERRRRVPLPTYPFERRRFRLAAKPGAAGPATVNPGARQPPSRWLYALQWKSKRSSVDLLAVPGPNRGGATGGDSAETPRPPWLVFDDGGLGPELAARLRAQGDAVVVVRAGDEFRRLAADEVSLAPGSPEDFRRLLADLSAEGRSPRRIVYLWTLDGAGEDDSADRAGPDAGLDAGLERSFYAPLFLAQALAGERSSDRVEVALVTFGTQQVGGDDRMVPENATLTGLARVIPQEIEGVGCRLLDVVPPAPSSDRPSGPESGDAWADLADRVAAELETGDDDPIIALRGRRRWVPVFEPCAETPATGSSPLATEADRSRTVLVTGGLGGLGWSFARRLGAEAGWNLVLTGRAELPAPERWDDWIGEHGEDDPTSRKIRRLETLQERGAEVLALAADVCDFEAMAEVLHRAEERFGRIDGVIHTAGLPGGGLIPLKTREAAAAVLAPKVRGTRVLERLLADRHLEFFVLCSSLAALAPPAGQVDYCAANAFLDAYAQAHARPEIQMGSGRWGKLVSIGWDAWREVGMAAEAVSPPAAGSDGGEPRRRRIVHGLSPDEGAEALERALRVGEAHVAVSTRELGTLLERRQRPRPEEPSAAAHEPASPAGERHERPALETPYVAPEDDVEIRIAEVWQDCLGVREVGRDDDFFDLGGDSLFATRIVSRLRRELGCDLALRDFLERPTVSGQAALVAELQRDSTSTDVVLGEILDEIG
jgi:acyl transferase domain-containing protein/acyl carrier protein